MRLSIFWRLTIGYAIILSFFLGLSSYSVVQLDRISTTAREAMAIDNRMIGYQEKLTDTFLSEVRYAGKFIITRTGSVHDEFLQFKRDFSHYMAEIQFHAITPDLKTRLSRVKELHLRYHDLFDQEVRYLKVGQIYAESRFQQEKEKVLENALAELDRLKRQLQKNLQDKLLVIERGGRAARTITGVSMLILLGVSIALAFFISKGITMPLSKLSDVTKIEDNENLNYASDIARIPEIQELFDALRNARRKLLKVAETNAHFANTTTEQFTIPLISLKKRLNYLNEELAPKVSADQRITFKVLTLEVEHLIQRCTDLASVPVELIDTPGTTKPSEPLYLRGTIASITELWKRAWSLWISLTGPLKTVTGGAGNPLAMHWNTIFQSIKLLGSGKVRKQ